MGLQGVSTESKAGTQDVQNLVRFIVENRIPAIFAESSFKNYSWFNFSIKFVTKPGLYDNVDGLIISNSTIQRPDTLISNYKEENIFHYP